MHRNAFEMQNTTKFPNVRAEYIICYRAQSPKIIKTSRKRPAAAVFNGKKQENTEANEM